MLSKSHKELEPRKLVDHEDAMLVLRGITLLLTRGCCASKPKAVNPKLQTIGPQWTQWHRSSSMHARPPFVVAYTETAILAITLKSLCGSASCHSCLRGDSYVNSEHTRITPTPSNDVAFPGWMLLQANPEPKFIPAPGLSSGSQRRSRKTAWFCTARRATAKPWKRAPKLAKFISKRQSLVKV